MLVKRFSFDDSEKIKIGLSFFADLSQYFEIYLMAFPFKLFIHS